MYRQLFCVNGPNLDAIIKDRSSKRHSNFSIDWSAVNDCGIHFSFQDVLRRDFHDVLRKDSKVGTFPNFQGTQRVFGE